MNNCIKSLKNQREVASHFGVGVATIRRWHNKGCPRVYVGEAVTGSGSRPRYSLTDVRAWLESRTAGKGGQV